VPSCQNGPEVTRLIRMNIFLVIAHPEPRSFNAALFQHAEHHLREAGHTLKTSDLYAMQFNPISGRQNFTTVKDPLYFKPQVEEIFATEAGGFAPDIEQELEKLEWCELMIWQFPLWWFGLPAVLKGWVDRVFAMGRTYGYGRMYDRGVFREKRVLLSVTTGGPQKAYEEDGLHGDIQAILRPIQRGILEFVGFSVLPPHIVYGPAHLTHDERSAALFNYSRRLESIATELRYVVGAY
jgi:NAD(P)H dehydrogenase (quinone)